MKHAVMVIGYGTGEILQHTIDLLDDEDIDFYIHWDKKYLIPNLTSHFSKIEFIKRRKAFWGTDTLTLIGEKLLETALNSSINYDYFHLISSSDMPLMTVNYFKKFFSGKSYVGFVEHTSEEERRRIEWYFPIRNMNVRKRINYSLIIKPLKVMNLFFKINRNKMNLPIEKGPEWFSITRGPAEKIVEYPYFNRFLHSFLSDEVYVQSILYKMKDTDTQVPDDNEQAARYIDWNRGTPFVFGVQNIEELRSLVNTKYAFARKIQDAKIIDEVYK
ncbi:beta-1,6-N-acetylglucosaminyltransferase [Secundilactobacillus mixtipabuli]|uniref:Peptide O-xylosyltransferase n=1 Tax=Secundilactobacillus mixtipabuli TaxID=1435342 RepID=A0A1Z5IC46_9LACO|nr:beta-1,6-N-acetylglucosaminyltransferase [Secundilactobacillus mixtipabuli]GAW99208.1 hypothetical protein IWT30_01169 [Secundilactobacillus mixtipabuli]